MTSLSSSTYEWAYVSAIAGKSPADVPLGERGCVKVTPVKNRLATAHRVLVYKNGYEYLG
jgi:hypothetical protein